MTVLGVLAWGAAAVSLWLGARRYEGAAGRGYRWLALGAALYCAGLAIQQVLGAALNPAPGLSLTDLSPLLALAAVAVGTAVLATGGRPPWHPPTVLARGDDPPRPPRKGLARGDDPPSPRRKGLARGDDPPRPPRKVMATSRRSDGTPGGQGAPGQDSADGAAGSVLPGLADGYVMAVALLVIGWITLLSGEFHRSGERPGTFLLALVHPLADLAVLGALLPVVAAAWRRAALPYLSLLAIAVADALAVGQRVLGGHPGVAAQLMTVVAAVLLGAAPWRAADPGWTRRTSSPAAATAVAALAAAVAALVVMADDLAGAPASGIALAVAAGAGVLVLAARAFMLTRENGAVLGIWRESSRSLRELASRTSDVALICDLDGAVRHAGPAVADYGYTPAALAGRRLIDFVHPEDRAAVLASVRLALGGYHPAGPGVPAGSAPGEAGEATGSPGPAAGSSGRFPARVRAADGTWRHVESTVLRYQAPGEPTGMLVTARDVSGQVALRQQVTYLTFHDGLTGLPNRAYVEERARDVLSDATAARRPGVIFLDLDRFTAVNDSVGHGAGDLVLAQTARRLRAAIPGHDTVARWGSDEFAVLVENAGNTQEMADMAERLASAVAAEPFRVAGQQIALTASVGVALADVDPPGLVLRNADLAMARAKDTGGDRVEVYAAHMHADVVRRLEIAGDLQRAVGNGELELQYQPIVELATSRVTGAEALVRWWHGDQPVPPREFLAAAEESGLIVTLGEWALREACAQGAAWRRSSPGAAVSVNLSPRQITGPGFTAQLAAILAGTGLPPEALTIELGEQLLAEEDGLVTDRLADLRGLGVRTALDEFGAGYASLAYLRRLPLDVIKIDPSFVAGLGRDDKLALLTRTVIQVGHDLGLRVIAAGIEQPRQLAALREMGCDYGQGSLVAAPMGAAGIEALLRTAGDEPMSGPSRNVRQPA